LTNVVLHFFCLAKHGVCQLINEYDKAIKRLHLQPFPVFFFSKNRIMDPFVARTFFPRASPSVRAVFLFLLRQVTAILCRRHPRDIAGLEDVNEESLIAGDCIQPTTKWWVTATPRSNRAGTLMAVYGRRSRCLQERSLCHTKTPMPSLANFCIYALFDPPFVKLQIRQN